MLKYKSLILKTYRLQFVYSNGLKITREENVLSILCLKMLQNIINKIYI